MNLPQKHRQEWIALSAVSPQITALNVAYYEGPDVVELLASKSLDKLGPHARFYVSGAQQRILERYEQPSKGGWGVFSLDPQQNWQRGDYFRFKPDQPYWDAARGRAIKYEGPSGVEARPVFLAVSYREAALALERMKLEPDDAAARQWWGHCRKASPAALLRPASPTEAVLAAGLLDAECDWFWEWVWRFDLPIVIGEGEKKAGALLSLGIPAIALPGIRNAVRTRAADGTQLAQPYLIADLAHFATEGREIVVAFDYEPRTKQRREMDLEIEKIKMQFGRKKAKVRVLDLPGPEKGVDDFIVERGGEALLQLLDQAPDFEGWTVSRYSRLTGKPSLELDQRYLGDLELPASAKLVCIKSPKGTGKTESFRNLVEEASAHGQRTLLITHRVQLGQAICDRVYLPYVSELRTAGEGDLLGFGVCIDSLHPESQARFNAADWKDALVIIDEAEQVIWHLLEGKTEIARHRLEVFSQLQQLLSGVLSSERGRVVLSDADLSDLACRFILSLTDSEAPVKPYIVVNNWKPSEPWRIFNYAQSRPEKWMAALIEHIEEGGRPFVCTQSQKTSSRWSTTTLETLFKQRFPALRVLRIDSQSVSDPHHEAYSCTNSLNQILGNYDIVIASPTIETGVSIDIRGHFTSVWGCAQGVLSENSTRQFLSRVRDPIPRHLWIQSFGVGRIGNGATSVKGVLAAEYKLAKKNAQMINWAAFGEEMLNAYGQVLGVWAAMACRINAGAVHYRAAVLRGLEAEGHHIENAASDAPVEQLKADLDEIKTRQHEAECSNIAQASGLSEAAYKKLKAKKTKTKAEWHQERHHEVAERYGVDVTAELVGRDSDGWYPQLRLFYYLTVGKAYLPQRDKAAFESQVSVARGTTWLPTLNRSQMGLKVQALEFLGVRKLLGGGVDLNGGTRASEADLGAGARQHYDDCHPRLWELAQAAHRFSWEIRAVLGVTISPTMSPIQIAQVILRKVGLKLTCMRQEGARGCRQRIYRYVDPADGRAQILGGWAIADATRSDSAVHTPGNKDGYTSEAAA